MKYFIVIAMIFLTACTKSGDTNAERTRVRLATPAQDNFLKEIVLGEASTPLLDKNKNRISNIALACSAISGHELKSGEVFSFNGIVGKRSKDRGYKLAPVILNGERDEGCGGGICQVSSTIYMAALNSSLQIEERHAHSESVPYAPKGSDATVVYGEKDMKFKNNTANTIRIYIWHDNDYVYAKIVKLM